MRWLRSNLPSGFTIRKVELETVRSASLESYQTVDGGQNVSGSSLEVLPDLETRVKKYVALDWKAVEAQLKERKSCGTVLHLPNETVRTSSTAICRTILLPARRISILKSASASSDPPVSIVNCCIQGNAPTEFGREPGLVLINAVHSNNPQQSVSMSTLSSMDLPKIGL